MTKDELLALAERVEALTGPSREVDAEIALAIGAVPAGAFRPCVAEDAGTFGTGAYSFWTCDPYTASLDAAMTLVPEGIGLSIQRYWIARVDGPVWSAEISTGGLPDKPRQVFDCYDTPTPALALVAAALRALATQGASHDQA